MSHLTVSVVIPCYNAERYVGEAIESALEQTYPHKEVIVIDDGSTDGSLKVIRSFGDAIRWESGPNRGACAARNRGLELARGELIQFLDADDILHCDKLEAQVPLAVRQVADVVYCSWQKEFVDRSEPPVICAPSFIPDPVVLTLQKIIGTPGPLYPRKLLADVGGFREELPCAQEYDLNLRLACRGATFYHLPEVLVTVRRVPGSVSSDSLRVLDQWAEIYWRAYRFLHEHGALTAERAEAFAAGLASHGRAYLRYGLTDRAMSRFRDAFQMHPSGGLRGAYGPWTRFLRRLVGPVAIEKLVQFKRRLTRRPVYAKA